MDKRQLLVDVLSGRISADDAKRAVEYPLINPFAFIDHPIDPSGKIREDDVCTFKSTLGIEPHFYDGMTYAEYVEACRQNPNADTQPITIVFHAPSYDGMTVDEILRKYATQ